MFQVKSDSRKNLMSQLKGSQAREALSYWGQISLFFSLRAFNRLGEAQPH